MSISLPGSVRLRPHPRSGFIEVGASAAAPFDPLTLLPVMWLKADAITGKSDGAAISSWIDSSGNTHPAAQATGSLQPLYKTAVQNSLPVVRFDGTDDRLVAAFGGLKSQPNTIAVVANVKANNCFVCDGDSGSTRHAIGDGLSTAGKIGMYAGSVLEGPAVGKPSGFSVWVGVFNGASSALYRDGASVASGAVGAQNPSGLTLGASNGGTSNLNGDIAELFFFTGALSTSDRQSIEGYLKSKWGTP